MNIHNLHNQNLFKQPSHKQIEKQISEKLGIDEDIVHEVLAKLLGNGGLRKIITARIPMTSPIMGTFSLTGKGIFAKRKVSKKIWKVHNKLKQNWRNKGGYEKEKETARKKKLEDEKKLEKNLDINKKCCNFVQSSNKQKSKNFTLSNNNLLTDKNRETMKNNNKSAPTDKRGTSGVSSAPKTVPWACNVAILGPSGLGKSASIENLPDETTLIFNTENKKLPFKKKFTYEERTDPDDYRQLVGEVKLMGDVDRVEKKGLIHKAINSSKFETIVIDSFSSWQETLEYFCRKYYGSAANKHAPYIQLNDETGRLLKAIKTQQSKIIFMTGIPENVMDIDGVVAKRIKVIGKKWEGMIEKEFPIVLHCEAQKTSKGIDYCFATQTDGITSAKSPRGMFEDKLIPNDLNYVVQKIKEYYSE